MCEEKGNVHNNNLFLIGLETSHKNSQKDQNISNIYYVQK